MMMVLLLCVQGQESRAKAGPTGADAKVIAHWNVVPYQAFSRPMTIGVVAFHINGVDRVEFQVNGKAVGSAREMTLNKRTNTNEYWITLDPKDFGPADLENPHLEVEATAYPKSAGIPRQLETILLKVKPEGEGQDTIVWVSARGNDSTGDGTKSNPFRQPARALEMLRKTEDDRGSAVFGTIYLTKGEYSWGSFGKPAPIIHESWIAVSAAPDVARGDVIFSDDSGGPFITGLLKVSGVTIRNVFFTPGYSKASYLWLDNVDVIGPGRWSGESFYHASNWGKIFFTGVRISDSPNGATNLNIARDVKIINIGSDAFSGSRLVVNSEVNGIDRGQTEAHPDVYQIYCARKSFENYIVYGLIAQNAEAQGIFAAGCESLDNVAMVNILLVRPLGSEAPLFSQWHVPSNHLIFSGISMPNSTFLWRNNEVRNVLIEGSLFQRMKTTFKGYGFARNTITYRDNHVMSLRGGGMLIDGLDNTEGNPEFADGNKGDFRPAPDSPLRGRVKAPFNNIDVYGNPRKIPSTIGAIE